MMLVSTFNLLLVAIAACFYISFPERGEVTKYNVELRNILSAIIGFILSIIAHQMMISGQVHETLEYASTIDLGAYAWIFYIIAFFLFVCGSLDLYYYITQRWTE